MARGGNVRVKFTGDSSDLERSARKAERSLDRMERAGSASLRGLGRAGASLGGLTRTLTDIGTTASIAIGAGLVYESKRAITAFQETRKVAAQTNAVLRSTGKAANVTATEVANLATAISRKTGVDDEAIQSGENLLLTFTRVRDEVGRGNDVFAQATRIATDMSVALGQDMKSSAIQVGKALNDPVKGVTALQRVGVSFTAQQKEQIKTLEQTGRHLDAQKLILRELNTEFAGSAVAQATPLDKARVAAGNLEETLGSGLAPAVDAVAERFTELASKAEPELSRLTRQVSRTFERDDLDLGEKITISSRKIQTKLAPLADDIRVALNRADLGDKLADAVEDAAPKVADAAGEAAPRAAAAFVNAFKEAGPWGKLITVAFLAQRLGAFSAAGNLASDLIVSGFRRKFGRDGTMAATAATQGAVGGAAYATAFEGAAATGIAGAGKKGKLRQAAGKLGRALGPVAALAMAAEFGPSLVDAAADSFEKNQKPLLDKIGSAISGIPGEITKPFRGGSGFTAEKLRERRGSVGRGGAGLDPGPLGALPRRGNTNEGANPRARAGRVTARASTSRSLARASAAPARVSRSSPRVGTNAPGFRGGGRRLSQGQVAQVWVQAGGGPDMADVMSAIAMGESGGNTAAHNQRGEDSRGLWQINVGPGANTDLARFNLFDPIENAKAAQIVLGRQGLDAWTVYSSGVYRQFLGGSGDAGGRATVGSGATGARGGHSSSSAFDLSLARADLGVERAGDSPTRLVPALQRKRGVVQRRVSQIQRSLKGSLSRDTRVRLTQELSQLLGDVRDLGERIEEITPEVATGPRAAGRGSSQAAFEQRLADIELRGADLGEPDATPGGGSVGQARLGLIFEEAFNKRQRLTMVERSLRRRLGPQTRLRLTQEAASLRGDLARLGEDATTIQRGSVDTPGAASIDDDLSMIDLRVRAGDLSADDATAAKRSLLEGALGGSRGMLSPRDWLEVKAALNDLTTATNQLSEQQRQRDDLDRQLIANQQRILALSNQGPAILASVVAAVNGGIGGRVGLGFQTPGAPGFVANYGG